MIITEKAKIYVIREDHSMVYVFCAYRDWALELYDKLFKKNKNFILIKSPEKLSLKKITKINPKYIFFPDWSWIVSDEIIENFQCICFHESNLPKFRGGSPIQNQIIRGIKKTKTSAFLMNNKLDAGDILLQKNLSLSGSIDEIFLRMINNDYEMINKIIDNKYKLKKQNGTPTTFKRRNKKQSELKTLNHSKEYMYNFIRMLGDPYPNAFIRIGKKKIIFKSVKYKEEKLIFQGEIE